MIGYLGTIWQGFWTAIIGMWITIREMVKPIVTLQYPEQKQILPERSRQRLEFVLEDCIGCGQCVRACPVDCITLVTEKTQPGEDLGKTSDGTVKKLHVKQFDIHMALCCYCGLCTEPCPTECLYMGPEYEFSTYQLTDLNYRYVEGIKPAPEVPRKVDKPKEIKEYKVWEWVK